jgi:hypothetical protein
MFSIGDRVKVDCIELGYVGYVGTIVRVKEPLPGIKTSYGVVLDEGNQHPKFFFAEELEK